MRLAFWRKKEADGESPGAPGGGAPVPVELAAAQAPPKPPSQRLPVDWAQWACTFASIAGILAGVFWVYYLYWITARENIRKEKQTIRRADLSGLMGAPPMDFRVALTVEAGEKYGPSTDARWTSFFPAEDLADLRKNEVSDYFYENDLIVSRRVVLVPAKMGDDGKPLKDEKGNIVKPALTVWVHHYKAILGELAREGIVADQDNRTTLAGFGPGWEPAQAAAKRKELEDYLVKVNARGEFEDEGVYWDPHGENPGEVNVYGSLAKDGKAPLLTWALMHYRAPDVYRKMLKGQEDPKGPKFDVVTFWEVLNILTEQLTEAEHRLGKSMVLEPKIETSVGWLLERWEAELLKKTEEDLLERLISVMETWITDRKAVVEKVETKTHDEKLSHTKVHDARREVKLDHQRILDGMRPEQEERRRSHKDFLEKKTREILALTARTLRWYEVDPLDNDGTVFLSRAEQDMAFVNKGMKDGMRKGMLFNVYKMKGKKAYLKAACEVKETTDLTSQIRVTWLKDKLDPVAQGDYIANPVFYPGAPKVFAVVGDIQAETGLTSLEVKYYLELYGNRVDGEVTVETDIVILGRMQIDPGTGEVEEAARMQLDWPRYLEIPIIATVEFMESSGGFGNELRSRIPRVPALRFLREEKGMWILSTREYLARIKNH